MNPDDKKPILNNVAYDYTKTFVTIVLPGLATLYFAISLIWDPPAVDMVLGVLATLAFIYGLTLRASAKRYLASDRGLHGEFVVKQDGGGAADFLLVLHADPEELANERRIVFKVRQEQMR